MRYIRPLVLSLLLACMPCATLAEASRQPAAMRATGFVFSSPEPTPKEEPTARKDQPSAGFVFSTDPQATDAPPADVENAEPAETPAETPAPTRYGCTTASGINIRAEASGEGEPLFRIRNSGTFFVILETVDGPKETRWHLVSFVDEAEGGEAIDGYIRADLVEEMTELEYLQRITPVRVISVAEMEAQANATPSPKDAPQTIATPRPDATSAPFIFQLPTP